MVKAGKTRYTSIVRDVGSGGLVKGVRGVKGGKELFKKAMSSKKWRDYILHLGGSPIGEGGYGRVYVGKYQGKKYVVKVQPVGGSAVREVSVLEYLKPLRVRGVGKYVTHRVVGENVYIYYEYVTGTKDLFDYIHSRRLTDVQKTKLFANVMGAVENLHAAGVVHFDIKPENILVLPDLRVQLIDFGMAMTSAMFRSEKKPLVVRFGTRGYMSGDSVRTFVGAKKSDMYSLGVTLSQLMPSAITDKMMDPDPKRRPYFKGKKPMMSRGAVSSLTILRKV